MSESRIDILRHGVAAIGKQQLAYWKFFPPFAERLERELGEYLGDCWEYAGLPAWAAFWSSAATANPG